jgi:hypothetical protein
MSVCLQETMALFIHCAKPRPSHAWSNVKLLFVTKFCLSSEYNVISQSVESFHLGGYYYISLRCNYVIVCAGVCFRPWDGLKNTVQESGQTFRLTTASVH